MDSDAASSSQNRLEAQVQRLVDEAELRQLLQRYAKGIVEGDRELVVNCFTPDLRLDYGFALIEGRDALREFMSSDTSKSALPVAGLKTAITRSQLFTTSVLRLEGTTAELESTGLSVHGGTRGEEPYVVVRSLRYHDSCVKSEDGWKIHHRQYTPQWAFEVPAEVVVPLPERQAP